MRPTCPGAPPEPWFAVPTALRVAKYDHTGDTDALAKSPHSYLPRRIYPGVSTPAYLLRLQNPGCKIGEEISLLSLSRSRKGKAPLGFAPNVIRGIRFNAY